MTEAARFLRRASMSMKSWDEYSGSSCSQGCTSDYSDGFAEDSKEDWSVDTHNDTREDEVRQLNMLLKCLEALHGRYTTLRNGTGKRTCNEAESSISTSVNECNNLEMGHHCQNENFVPPLGRLQISFTLSESTKSHPNTIEYDSSQCNSININNSLNTLNDNHRSPCHISDSLGSLEFCFQFHSGVAFKPLMDGLRSFTMEIDNIESDSKNLNIGPKEIENRNGALGLHSHSEMGAVNSHGEGNIAEDTQQIKNLSNTSQLPLQSSLPDNDNAQQNCINKENVDIDDYSSGSSGLRETVESTRQCPRRMPSLSGSFGNVDGIPLHAPNAPVFCSLKRGSSLSDNFEIEGVDIHDTSHNAHREEQPFTSSCKGIIKSHSNDDASTSNTKNCTNKEIKKCEDNTNSAHTSSVTKINIFSEDQHLSQDSDIISAKEFDTQIISKLTTLDDSHQLLRRTRAVSALASRLMAAPDEKSCFELVTKLLVPLFSVDRCSYFLAKDNEHGVLKTVSVKERGHAQKLGLDEKKGEVVVPFGKSAIGVCKKTGRQVYTPNTKYTPFEMQRKIHSMGLNSVLVTPIIVNQNRFIGAIQIGMVQVDAFQPHDRLLINDIASMLGANVYAKRLRIAAENANKISREMLHSLIPSKVIEKIECFWDKSSYAYKKRNSTDLSVGSSGGPSDRGSISSLTECKEHLNDVNEKISFLQGMNSATEDVGVVVDFSEMELKSTSRALYAENVRDVCIIFVDVVGFSKMALEMKPIQIVNMLQDVFSRFDSLCDKHEVHKLETIGDAYICTTGLLDRESDNVSEEQKKAAALNALAMAEDMVLETQKVFLPGNKYEEEISSDFRTVQIRVGIHIGDVTCGVLGERLPKFTVFGTAVNLAARMEQTSNPSKIRVTKDFHDLVADAKRNWGECQVISVKNMGSVGTYILDPLRDCPG